MPNRLAREGSPYLQQHAANPVDWYPWGEEAFNRAQAENLPIHLSIGYAACHWCHVMAHESFEDLQIAQLLNERFVNIKVDRQERPDIDDVYQNAVQMMGQSGGWPLTVFLTPQREPFFAGTYFPPRDRHGRPGFTRLIVALSDAWRREDRELLGSVEAFRKGFDELDRQTIPGGAKSQPDLPAAAAHALVRQMDPVHGGFHHAPKFPNPSCLDLILRIVARTGDASLFRPLQTTLDRMAAGGIYDQLGGGFARYSVDDQWAVPHFEKMLYDNGQLVRLYADAYRLTGSIPWRRTFEHSIEYVLRDLTAPEGAFLASEDADSEGQEGRYYLWTPAEVRAQLGDEDGAFACRALGITAQGNFEAGRSVPHRPQALNDAEQSRLDALLQVLLRARQGRVRPLRDGNVIASWNGLMIQGLCAAFQATGVEAYLDSARRAADFIQRELSMPDGGLYRVWRGGSARVPGFLDDYAEIANALLDVYECCFEERYLGRAVQLVERVLADFWDEGFYYTPASGERLVYRPRAPFDHAWPSGNSSAVFALVRLYELFGKALYLERAEQVAERLGGAAERNPFGFARLLAAIDFARQGPLSIVLAGDARQSQSLVEPIHRAYLPARVLALAQHVPSGRGRDTVDGQAAAYVCRQQTCQLAAVTAPQVRQRLDAALNRA